MFPAELEDKARSLVDRYPVGRSALLPLLHLVQCADGYISDDGVAECARLLGLTKAEVMAVATFYSMYKRAPMGRHLVSVCTNFSCKVRGADEVYQRLSERLGVGHNETSEDGAVTLEHAECLGNCEGAPVVTVDYFNYECLDPDAAEALVDSLVAGTVPMPTRGYPSPGIRDVSHRLAGLGPRGDAATEPGAAPDQTTAADAAPPGTAAGPGADPASASPLEAKPAEFAGSEGGGAEETGPEGLGVESGGGGHGYGGASAEREDPTDPAGDPAGDSVQEGSDG